ncbi:hypothetical protein GLOIN_2v1783316 [Rhizophagus clarus]|uniref:F-box domain-containing protein n=1 Tax=Rhizophagus clarus TaxID=94130 RepID=A0A8H3KRV6_9GLOM|nr:hypothetical protein GLOIN_2v1783316 [Rhizophagus clarus]
MSNLNEDVIYLIIEQVQNDKKTLHLCLFVNKTWCEPTVPILWKNLWKRLINKEKENYCRQLDLDVILRIIDENIDEKSKILNVQDEILNLFINENTEFTHLYMPENFEHQIHNGVECCFSKIEFLSCSTAINNNILTKLVETCKSIKELKLVELENNNYEIVKLIKTQRKLTNIDLS